MNRKCTGKIFNIQRYSLHDGPGIRITVFMQGCPLSCWWCHNPEGQDSVNSIHASIMSVDDVMFEVKKERVFFDESGGGVTFSGGEPLMQIDFLSSMLRSCIDNDIHTALDTCGYASNRDFLKVLADIDLFLFDLKIMDDEMHKKYTGISNKPILENLSVLNTESKPVIIRFPIIPDLTDTDENLDMLADYLSKLKNVKRISLLPYHKIAYNKYSKNKIANKMVGVEKVSSEKLNMIKDKLESIGMEVKTGG